MQAIVLDPRRTCTLQALLERSLQETEAELDNLARNRARLQRLLQRNARQLDLNEHRQQVGRNSYGGNLRYPDWGCAHQILIVSVEKGRQTLGICAASSTLLRYML